MAGMRVGEEVMVTLFCPSVAVVLGAILIVTFAFDPVSMKFAAEAGGFKGLSCLGTAMEPSIAPWLDDDVVSTSFCDEGGTE